MQPTSTSPSPFRALRNRALLGNFIAPRTNPDATDPLAGLYDPDNTFIFTGYEPATLRFSERITAVVSDDILAYVAEQFSKIPITGGDLNIINVDALLCGPTTCENPHSHASPPSQKALERVRAAAGERLDNGNRHIVMRLPNVPLDATRARRAGLIPAFAVRPRNPFVGAEPLPAVASPDDQFLHYMGVAFCQFIYTVSGMTRVPLLTSLPVAHLFENHKAPYSEALERLDFNEPQTVFTWASGRCGAVTGLYPGADREMLANRMLAERVGQLVQRDTKACAETEIERFFETPHDERDAALRIATDHRYPIADWWKELRPLLLLGIDHELGAMYQRFVAGGQSLDDDNRYNRAMATLWAQERRV